MLIFLLFIEYRYKLYKINELDIIPKCEFSKKKILNILKQPIKQWVVKDIKFIKIINRNKYRR